MMPTRRLYLSLMILAGYAAPSLQKFNPNATDNLIVYFGQSSGKDASLEETCGDPNIDAVVAGFVRSFDGTEGYPTVDFGPICSDRRSSEVDVAPGLAICADMARQVQFCQDSGKAVFISIGGAMSDTNFEGDGDAKSAAVALWNLFGEGTADSELRPLGNVTVDGFDIDHEVGSPSGYGTFAATLQDLMKNATKPMFLSATPSCMAKSPVITSKTLALVDFIFVRFYNARACALGTNRFKTVLNKWSAAIPKRTSRFPKFYLAALSFNKTDSGYVAAKDLASAIKTARRTFGENKFGGVTLWDGPRGLANTENGNNFIEYTKNVLEGS